MLDIHKRAKELRILLNNASHAYYILDSPFIEDTVYDGLYRELLELEESNPSLQTEDSPTKRVGGMPSDEFKSIKHNIPLLSLDNAFNYQELIRWYERLTRAIGKSYNESLPLVGELKIDGNAIALSYEQGVLVQAATRGDGNQGEEITNNVRTINTIPLRLQLDNPPEWVEVRGEAFIPEKTFAEINHERETRGEELFANPRNACAGTLRQLDPKVVFDRHLDFFAYALHLPEEEKLFGQWEALGWLERAGFRVNANRTLSPNLADIYRFYEICENDRYLLPYATDGVVVKLNERELQDKAGFTQKAPRWAIALKYAAEEAPSILLRVNVQVGRTGTITPVAEFKTLNLAGTKVCRATLHNADRIAELDLYFGDTIVIRKAGDIIPEVVKVLPELRQKGAEKVKLPNHCPECNSSLVSEATEIATRCINSKCPAILRGVILHWASKAALDIDGLGSKLIEKLVNERLVKSIADLYGLDLQLLISLEGMGVKSATNLVKALDNSKKMPWYRQLYGLGIRHIGKVNAKALASTFPSIQKLIAAEPKDIYSVQGIGLEICQSLMNWFDTPGNQHLIEELYAVGFSLEAKEIKQDKIRSNDIPLEGKKLVITGTLPNLSRNNAIKLIEAAGGKVTNSISKNTDFLLAGTAPGNKLGKAEALGIRIIHESQLINLCKK